jgi:hypothetical protein
VHVLVHVHVHVHVLVLVLAALACAPRPEPPPTSPRTPRAPPPPRPEPTAIEVELRAFICPAGTSLLGRPPPDGDSVHCERDDGVRQGPFARWDANGRLAELGEYDEGDLLWSLPCVDTAPEPTSADLCDRLSAEIF